MDWLVGDHLLLRDFGTYRVIFINAGCYNCCPGSAVMVFWALCSVRNGPVYAGIPYRNFFLLLCFIQAPVNVYPFTLFSISSGIS
jgi:hypothetical protein